MAMSKLVACATHGIGLRQDSLQSREGRLYSPYLARGFGDF